MGKKYHLKYYPDSIASEYLRRTNKKDEITYGGNKKNWINEIQIIK